MTYLRKSTSRKIFEAVNVIILILLCVVMLYPFLYVLAASFSNNASIQAGRVGVIPEGFNIFAYMRVFRYPIVWTSYANTLLYTASGTLVSLLLTVLGAYPLSRRDFYGRNAFTVLIAITMFFSGGLIPSFLLVRGLHMYNTIWAVIIPGSLSTSNLIIMRTFFQNIPDELEEAAIIDGASDLQVLVRVIIPLSVASLMTIGMFYAVGQWNSWFSAMIYLRDREKHPLQLILRQIVLQNQVNEMTSMQAGTTIEEVGNVIGETVKYAVIVVAVVPILCVYPFIQKYFVKGVMVGSIKG